MYFSYQVQISQYWRSQITETITISFFKAHYTVRITLSLEITSHTFCYRLIQAVESFHTSYKFFTEWTNIQLSQESGSVFTDTLSPLHSLDNISSQINAILIPTLYVQKKSLHLHLQQSSVRTERIPAVIKVCLITESSISYNAMHNARN